MVKKTLAACIGLVALAFTATAPADARPKRFHGDVAGVGSGPGHSFSIGNGLHLRFRDTYRSFTRYRVCYTRGAGRRCWRRTSGRKGRLSRIFITAPNSVGNYTARWYVGGRVVARWSWYNGPGD